MTLHRWMMAAATVAVGLPVYAQDPRYGASATTEPASSGVKSPLVAIYRVSGVYDDGGGVNTGRATSFLCSSFSGVDETIRFVIRDEVGAIRKDDKAVIIARGTRIVSTHQTIFVELTLDTGALPSGGLATISATTTNLHCSAMIVDGASPNNGVALHMVRLNKVSGTEE
jgi:hypothetical protein